GKDSSLGSDLLETVPDRLELGSPRRRIVRSARVGRRVGRRPFDLDLILERRAGEHATEQKAVVWASVSVAVAADRNDHADEQPFEERKTLFSWHASHLCRDSVAFRRVAI